MFQEFKIFSVSLFDVSLDFIFVNVLLKGLLQAIYKTTVVFISNVIVIYFINNNFYQLLPKNSKC